ncbi:MAG: two-component system, OmpR family, phosphate regulon response regulator PhoB [Parcubacteria bacterium C7867-005]|nr:MAG: two-component system, OmpR family, phosphate regulon response regulator PhoB [Parcubacteria bacterium C7867-005]
MAKEIKVFIVEDDSLMSDMYKNIFELSGYEVEMASDGIEALEKLEKMDPLPVVMMLDIMMPKLNGLEVLEKMKNNEKFKKIPVVICLTNLAGKEDAEKALALGAVKYLVKSEYNPKEVVAKAKEAIDEYLEKNSS